MLDQKTFEADVERCWSALMANHIQPRLRKKTKQNKAAEIARAFTLYKNAFSNPLTLMILGEQKMRQDHALLENFGRTSSDPAPSLESAENRGSVLMDKNWWPLLNYAWLLGGVHRKSAFHLALDFNEHFLRKPENKKIKFKSDDLIWDTRKQPHRARVLGTELLFLSASGYRTITYDSKEEFPAGFVFEFIEDPQTQKVTITSYVRRLDQTKRKKLVSRCNQLLNRTAPWKKGEKEKPQ